MTKALSIAAATAILIHTSSIAAPSAPAPIRVGIVDDPCGQSPRDSADFFNLCRYRAANLSLPRASSSRIVFMGDSITEGWKESRPAFFRGDRVDRGISGQTTSQMLGRFYADVIALRPAVVHILAGTNDIAGNGGPTTLDGIENNIRSMVELAQAHRIKVVLGTVLPAARFGWRPDIDPVPSIQALNAWIRRYARSRGIAVVDYYALLDDGHHALAAGDSGDGVHPTPAGYAKMEAALSARLNRGGRR
jgi:lysophospholipase L1-like esterase